MKIWFLTGRFGDGGLERVLVELARAMRTHGFDTRLITGRFHGNAQKLVPPDVPCSQIAPYGRGLFPFALSRALRDERPDVVFTCANDVACMMLAIRSIASPSTRVVTTQHLSLSGPRLSATGLHRGKMEAIRLLMHILLPRSDAMVAVSKALARNMSHELSIPEDRIEVIYNPVVTPDMEARIMESVKWPWESDHLPTIVFVGRLEKVKRVDLLVEAFASINTQVESRLLIVGTGSEEGAIRQQIREKGLEEHCALVGYQPNPLPYIRRSDVLVLPSDYEGFGLVLVEAMACGTQVISTDCPDGPAEILGNGRFGQLVPCGNADALASAIIRVLTGQFLIPSEKLVERAQSFTLDRSCQAYMSLVARVMDRIHIHA